MRSSLKKIASDPLNTVYVISGRDQGALEEWVGDLGVGIQLSFCFGVFAKSNSKSLHIFYDETVFISNKKAFPPNTAAS